MPAGFKVVALNNSVVPVYVGLGRVGRVVMQRIAKSIDSRHQARNLLLND
jgi:hypothetical protein